MKTILIKTEAHNSHILCHIHWLFEICSISSRSRVLAHRPWPKLEMFCPSVLQLFYGCTSGKVLMTNHGIIFLLETPQLGVPSYRESYVSGKGVSKSREINIGMPQKRRQRVPQKWASKERRDCTRAVTDVGQGKRACTNFTQTSSYLRSRLSLTVTPCNYNIYYFFSLRPRIVSCSWFNWGRAFSPENVFVPSASYVCLLLKKREGACALFVLQCIQKFFPKLCLILKEWFLTRFPPNFQERFLMSSASPEFVFWGPKIKQFCFKQV